MIRNFTKFRKGRNKGFSLNKLVCCDYGIKALSRGFLEQKQIEAVRKVFSKKIKNKGKIFIRVHPNVTITKKPIEVRMGSGKGEIFSKIYKVKPGSVLFEVDCDYNNLKKIFYLASSKLPVKTCVCFRDNLINI